MAAVPFTFGIRLLVGQALSYWINHGGLSFFDAYREEPTFIGRKMTLVFDRPAESFLSTRDTEMFSIALFKISATEPSPDWDDSDYEDVETVMTTWWGAVKTWFPDALKLEEIRWYQEGPEIVPPNPVVRTTSIAVAGTGGDAMCPPQVSTTVTMETPQRKYWGRVYLPAPITDAIDTNDGVEGRWNHTFVDAMANDMQDALNDIGGLGIIPAVYSRAGLSFLAVTGVEVDDVPDIQRRRRFATTGYRKALTLG